MPKKRREEKRKKGGGWIRYSLRSLLADILWFCYAASEMHIVLSQTETDYKSGTKPIVSIRKAQLNLVIFFQVFIKWI